MTGRRGIARRLTALTAAAAWLAAGNASAFLDTGTLLTNAASATYTGGGQGTSVTYSATAKILVANPAVYLWKENSGGAGFTPEGWVAIPAAGGTVTYTLCFSNGGANTAFNVTILDKMPNSSSWLTLGYTAWWSQLNGTGAPLTTVGYSANGLAPHTAGTPPNLTAAPLGVTWTVPALGIGRSGCIQFLLKFL